MLTCKYYVGSFSFSHYLAFPPSPPTKHGSVVVVAEGYSIPYPQDRQERANQADKETRIKALKHQADVNTKSEGVEAWLIMMRIGNDNYQ